MTVPSFPIRVFFELDDELRHDTHYRDDPLTGEPEAWALHWPEDGDGAITGIKERENYDVERISVDGWFGGDTVEDEDFYGKAMIHGTDGFELQAPVDRLDGIGQTDVFITNTAHGVVENKGTYPAAAMTVKDGDGKKHVIPANKINIDYSYCGVDGVNAVAKHENAHVLIFDNWVEGGAWEDVYGPYLPAIKDKPVEDLIDINDHDLDTIPTDEEIRIGTDPHQITTYGNFYLSGIDDEVWIEVEHTSKAGAADHSKDWAFPGKQSTPKN